VPKWKWDEIAMDFVEGYLGRCQQKMLFWVVVDGLSKTTHFIAMRFKDPMYKLARLYIHNIVRLHGVPTAIISEHDAQFNWRFWHSLQKEIGTYLKFSAAFHPQTDCQLEKTIQILEDM
jgi:hypothetical protein